MNSIKREEGYSIMIKNLPVSVPKNGEKRREPGDDESAETQVSSSLSNPNRAPIPRRAAEAGSK